MGEYYYENWVKDTKEFDEFFFKIVKLSFIHGDDENRFTFIKRMIRITRNHTGVLSDLLSETYKETGQYLNSYVYSIKANKPYLTIELLQDHIMETGYYNEADLFKLRAVLEYMIYNMVESAKICYDKLWSSEESNPHKNMAKAIMICCEKDRFDIYKKVKEGYQEIINSDPHLFNYMEKISMQHFEKPLKQPNMMQQMMKSMFS